MISSKLFRYIIIFLSVFVVGYFVVFVVIYRQPVQIGDNLEDIVKRIRVDEGGRFQEDLKWAEERFEAKEALWKLKEQQWEESASLWRRAYEKLLSQHKEYTEQTKVEIDLLKKLLENHLESAQNNDPKGAVSHLEEVEKQLARLKELEDLVAKKEESLKDKPKDAPTTIGSGDSNGLVAVDKWEPARIEVANPPHIRVLYWTPVYGATDWDWFAPCPEYPECKVGFDKCKRVAASCTQVRDHNEANNVDAIVFHSRDLHGGFPQRNNKIPWVLLGKESAAHDPLLRHSGQLDQFNITMTYRYDTSDVQWSYIDWPELETVFNMPVPIEKKKKDVPIAWVASNCGMVTNKRTDYVKEMMKYVKIDSFGPCLSTASMPSDYSGMHRGLSAIETTKKYKFYLAFENSNCNGYLSEKFWRPIVSGTVPIVLGAPDVDRYAPTPHSIIKASDFPSAKALAEYINMLNENDEEYKKYLSYKFDRKLSRHFIEFWENSYAGCYHMGLCDYLAKIKLGIVKHPANKHPEPDTSCENADAVKI